VGLGEGRELGGDAVLDEYTIEMPRGRLYTVRAVFKMLPDVNGEPDRKEQLRRACADISVKELLIVVKDKLISRQNKRLE
jgi:hypothetical protein